MNATLLSQFLSEECTPYVRDLLLSAIEGVRSGTAPSTKRFEFNRFEVTIEADEKAAVLEDVLDATDAGVQRISLHELETKLRAAGAEPN